MHTARTVLLCTGGYSNVYFLSTNALKSNTSAIWRAHRKGALFANPCFTQIHPTCIPSGDVFQSKLTLMSESLRNDGRVWLPKNPGETRQPDAIPEEERDYFLERLYPTYGNMTPRTSPPGGPENSATRGGASAQADARFTSTSPMPSELKAKTPLPPATAT